MQCGLWLKPAYRAAIERRDLGDALKGTGIGALVDTIAGSIAEKIGQAARAKVNPLSRKGVLLHQTKTALIAY